MPKEKEETSSVRHWFQKIREGVRVVKLANNSVTSNDLNCNVWRSKWEEFLGFHLHCGLNKILCNTKILYKFSKCSMMVLLIYIWKCDYVIQIFGIKPICNFRNSVTILGIVCTLKHCSKELNCLKFV